LILLNTIYKPIKVYCLRTSVRGYCTSYIFYLRWNYELTLHLLMLTFTSLPLS